MTEQDSEDLNTTERLTHIVPSRNGSVSLWCHVMGSASRISKTPLPQSTKRRGSCGSCCCDNMTFWRPITKHDARSPQVIFLKIVTFRAKRRTRFDLIQSRRSLYGLNTTPVLSPVMMTSPHVFDLGAAVVWHKCGEHGRTPLNTWTPSASVAWRKPPPCLPRVLLVLHGSRTRCHCVPSSSHTQTSIVSYSPPPPCWNLRGKKKYTAA